MSSQDRRRSMKYIYICAVMGVSGGAMISPRVMGLAVLKLGGGDFFLGLLNFACMFTNIFGLFTMSAIEYYGKRRVLLAGYGVSTILLASLLLVPTLAVYWSAQNCLIFIVVAIFVLWTAYYLGFTGWFPIIHDIVPRRLTGRFFGNLRTYWATSSLLVLLGIAWLLGTDPEWWKFRVLFFAALLTYVVQFFSLIPLKEKPPLRTKATRTPLPRMLKEFLANKKYHWLIGYLFSYIMAIAICEPFKIKFLKDMGYSEGFIMAAGAMMSIGLIISLRIWGKLVDRFGNRFVFSVSHIAISATLLMWLLVDKSTFGGILVFVLYLVQSIFVGGNGIARTRYVMHIAPADKQNDINLLSNVVFVSWGIVPLIGAMILKLAENFHLTIATREFNNYHLLFVISAGLFVIPHLLSRKLGLSKDTPTSHVLIYLSRPLTRLMGPLGRYVTKNDNNLD